MHTETYISKALPCRADIYFHTDSSDWERFPCRLIINQLGFYWYICVCSQYFIYVKRNKMLRCCLNLFFPHRFSHTHTHTYWVGWRKPSRDAWQSLRWRLDSFGSRSHNNKPQHGCRKQININKPEKCFVGNILSCRPHTNVKWQVIKISLK